LEEHKRRERAQAIGLFRYQLICPALEAGLSTKQRGRLVREIADRHHVDPFGARVQIARPTLDRWIRRYRAGGFEALVPEPRRLATRTDAGVLELAASLKRENPSRTAAQVARILRTATGWAPSESTLLRHFHRCELMGPAAGHGGEVFGRFEAADPNELWVGDALHGPRVGDRKTYLFAFLDDHSRLVVGHRFGFAEDTVRLAAALKPALAARGVPAGVYVDNGSAFVDAWLLRACAKLGIRLVHSAPGRPQGRGKIEYHRRTHTETGQSPLHRWETGWDRLGHTAVSPTAADLTEAFLWSEFRVVTKTATVSLHANTYRVDPALAGRRVELVFSPFDLETIKVRHGARSFGTAVPHTITRHAHPKARPETDETPPAPTGIDYLALTAAAHHDQLREDERIGYHALYGTDPDDEQVAQQLSITDLGSVSGDFEDGVSA
jgi:transposase InsO family protein